jgi:hypothetical protein
MAANATSTDVLILIISRIPARVAGHAPGKNQPTAYYFTSVWLTKLIGVWLTNFGAVSLRAF